MEKVRAKFKCNSVTSFESNKNVGLSVVTDGSEENKSFANYTPNGNINLSIDNGTDAADYFEPGKEYYVDFEVVTAPEAQE